MLKKIKTSRHGKIDNTSDQISVNALSSGIYFLSIKELSVQKVVIK